jgi:hypothetical protein
MPKIRINKGFFYNPMDRKSTKKAGNVTGSGGKVRKKEQNNKITINNNK